MRGKWYVSIQTEYEATEPQHESTSILGCLMQALQNLPRFPDGTVVPARQSEVYRVNQRKLARLSTEIKPAKSRSIANWLAKKKRQNLERPHISAILYQPIRKELPSQSHQ